MNADSNIHRNGKEFQYICSLSELPLNSAKKILVNDHSEIALFHRTSGIFASSNICPHQHSSVLSEGFVDDDCTLICPLHSYSYDLRTGECLTGGSTLKIFETIVEDGNIFIENPPLTPPRWCDY